MIYLTSDLHFGHSNIIGFCQRPFVDPEHMNEMLIEKWNEEVQPGDTVYILGDFALGTIADTLPLAARLNGEKILLPGNHDRVWCGGKPAQIERFTEAYARYFDVINNTADNMVGELLLSTGEYAIMSHFPYVGDSHEDQDRFSAWRPDDYGEVLLHGHVHDSWTIKRSPKGTLMINVGVDVWDYKPVSLGIIEAIIEEQGVNVPIP